MVQKAIRHIDKMDEPLQIFANRDVQTVALSGGKQPGSLAKTYGTCGSGKSCQLSI